MTQIPRRGVLRGGIASAAALNLYPNAKAMSASAALSWTGSIISVAHRKVLASLDEARAGCLVYLDEHGREGLFRLEQVAALEMDPLQGLAVSARRPGWHWSRVWDGTHGRPEWFGAIVNDPAADCADALEACHRFCPVTELAQADYFVRRTVWFGHSWRTVRGSGRYATDQGQGTRIVFAGSVPGSRTDDIIILGSSTRPKGDLVTEAHLQSFTIIRDAPAQAHLSGDLARYPTGLRCAYLSHCTVSGVASLESSVGFHIGGVVYTKIDDCLAQRTRAGEGKGEDRAAGYFLDGRVRFGYPGGNASLYMDRCVAAEQHAHHVEPAGLIALGAFVDSFIDRFESARIDTGMAFQAAGARGFGETIDLHIRNPILDGCGRFGLDLNLDATASACIEIVDPYVTPSGGRGDRGIAIRDGAGLVTITGGQVLGDFAEGSLFISRTRGVRVQGLKIAQAIRPVVAVDASGLQLEPQISNWQKTSPYPAVAGRNLSRSIVRPIVIGFDAPAFGSGVDLDAASHHVQIDGSAIDPDCLTGGVAAKALIAGNDARNTRMAGGNLLVGIID